MTTELTAREAPASYAVDAQCIRPGYKQAETGVIPSDWNEKKWGDVILHCSSGATPYRGRPDFYKGDIKWIASGELNYNVITDSLEHISKDAVEKTSLRIHPEGTFLMAITGLEAAGTRGACGIVGSPAATNQSCMAVYPSPELLTEYLYHYYIYRGDELALKYCQGTKQQSYTARLIRILPIQLPPTNTEQAAIAEVLSDADALIASLERLIAKKRQFKQGAMQELLAGKKRLPGFGGEWVAKRLGTVLKFQVGFPFSSLFFNEDGQGVRLVKNRDLKNDGQVFYYSGKFDQEFLVQNGDVLVGMDGDFLPCLWMKGQALLNQRVGRIVPLAGLNRVFAYYFLIGPLKEIENATSSTTVKHLSHGDIGGIEKPLPTVEEQTAIAAILSDMDAEIASLEQQLAKARGIKQGMMQELLTGRIRLV